MSIRLTKPWIALAGMADDSVPAQLGVFQLGTEDGSVAYIGVAGGREPFGLQTAVAAARERATTEGWGPVTHLRYEVTHGYMSRWHELLMVHEHDNGSLPPGNPSGDRPGGRLRPIASTGP